MICEFSLRFLGVKNVPDGVRQQHFTWTYGTNLCLNGDPAAFLLVGATGALSLCSKTSVDEQPSLMFIQGRWQEGQATLHSSVGAQNRSSEKG